jgi:hypothetical protein
LDFRPAAIRRKHRQEIFPMETGFVQEMKESILGRYFNHGNRRFLFWGANIYFLELMRELAGLGLKDVLTAGLVDNDKSKHGGKYHGIEVLPPERIGSLDFDTLVVMSDRYKEEIIADFQKLCDKKPNVLIAGTAHIYFKDELYEKIRKQTKDMDDSGALDRARVFQCLKYLAANGVSGSVLELGVAAGATTRMIAATLKKMGAGNTIYGIDTFGGYPDKESLLDLMHKGHPSDESYQDYTFDSVQQRCAEFPNIRLIKGEVSEAIKALSHESFMFSFFDMNTYSATRAPLDFVYERTVPGGILCFDHYDVGGYGDCLGQRTAIREFLSDKEQDLCLFMSNMVIKSPWKK